MTWRRMLDPAEPMWGALARTPGTDGRAVGMVHWIFHRSCWTIGDYCYLQDLFVDPAVRGGGVGGALIDWLVAESKRRGWARLYWNTRHDNHAARALYDKYGPESGFVRYVLRIEP